MTGKRAAAVAIGLLLGLACSKPRAPDAEIAIGEYSSMTGTTATFGQSTGLGGLSQLPGQPP